MKNLFLFLLIPVVLLSDGYDPDNDCRAYTEYSQEYRYFDSEYEYVSTDEHGNDTYMWRCTDLNTVGKIVANRGDCSSIKVLDVTETFDSTVNNPDECRNTYTYCKGLTTRVTYSDPLTCEAPNVRDDSDCTCKLPQDMDDDGDGNPNKCDPDSADYDIYDCDGDGDPNGTDPDDNDPDINSDSTASGSDNIDSSKCGSYLPFTSVTFDGLGYFRLIGYQRYECNLRTINDNLIFGYDNNHYVSECDLNACPDVSVIRIKPCYGSKEYSPVLGRCANVEFTDDCVVLPDTDIVSYGDNNCAEQFYCEDETVSHQNPIDCPDSNGDGVEDDNISVVTSKDSYKLALTEYGASTSSNQDQIISNQDLSNQILDDIKDHTQAVNDSVITSNKHLDGIDQGIQDLLDKPTASLDTASLETKTDMSNTLLAGSLYSDLAIPDHTSVNTDSQSMMDGLVSDFENMQTGFMDSYDAVVTGIEEVESGFTTHMVKSSVTTCPRSFTFDLTKGNTAPITFDVCETFKQLYPTVYMISYLLLSVTFISFTFMLIMGL